MENKYYITAKDVMEIWGVKESTAYNLVRRANQDLKKLGCYVVAGKCPRDFFLKKMGVSTINNKGSDAVAPCIEAQIIRLSPASVRENSSTLRLVCRCKL